MSDLHDLLDRATDRIESPDLALSALAGARRRRASRRGGVAAALAVAVVVVVALAGQGGGGSDSTPPVAPTPTAPTETAQPTRWDPRDAGELPWARGHLADPVAPPASASALAGEPLSAALMAVPSADGSGGPTVFLLGTDGTWRSVPRDDTSYAGVDLSADGTRLAVETTQPDGVDVWDVTTGERQHLDPPEGYRPWEYQGWAWVDDRTLLFYGAGSWLVDVRTGAAEPVDYPRRALAWDIDRSGALVQSADFDRPSVLTDWSGGRPREMDLSPVGRFTSLATDADAVVGGTYENGPYTIVAVDRDDASPVAELPIRDPRAEYGNGRLQVVGMRADGSALLQVSDWDTGPSGRTWQLVAWDPVTGLCTLVAHSGPGVGVPLALAANLLG